MADETIKQCRIWWPRHRSSSERCESMVMLGWAIRGICDSVDIVVAALLPFRTNSESQNLLHPSQNQLQVIIQCSKTRLPCMLQEHAELSVVGYRILNRSPCCSGRKIDCNGGVANSFNISKRISSTCKYNNNYNNSIMEHKKTQLYEKHEEPEIRSSLYINLLCNTHKMKTKGLPWIPVDAYLYLEGVMCVPAIHILLYEPPKYGSHHFSHKSWKFLFPSSDICLQNDRRCSSIPQWMADLDKKHGASNLDIVMLAINCTATVESLNQEQLKPLGRSCKRLSFFEILLGCIQKFLAVSVAIIATLFYIAIQWTTKIFSKNIFLYPKIIAFEVFKQTLITIQIRRGQMLYWPSILSEIGFRVQPNISVAHHSSILKHSMWSTIAVDILFGSVIGSLLLKHCDVITSSVVQLAHSITDQILRSGCVWLMGVPAGFKLNTELAQALGMISLTIIQVWATFWFFVQHLLKYSINILAAAGFFLGFTIQAAMVIDILLLATLHITALHWFFAFIYGHQIQWLAALARLFRGRKRNPLRARTDSFDYSVEQHVVGSLLFTPLLLILPTTSLFYIFFTILTSAIGLFCISLELLISVLHSLPYAEIIIWLICPKRFPSGIWLEQLMAGKMTNALLSSNIESDSISSISSAASKTQNSTKIINVQSFDKCQPFAVSVLGSRTAALDEIVSRHLVKAFNGLSLSYGASCAYKVFSGGRIPFCLNIGMRAPMSRISISLKEFLWLTYEAVLDCL